MATPFLDTLPLIAYLMLGTIGLVALWFLWRIFAPAAPGVSLGYFEVIGRYAGQKLLKRLRGVLVECTPLFLNSELDRQFREIIAEDLEAYAEKETGEKALELKELAEKVRKQSLENLCRIIAVRDRGFSKHLLVQYGNVDKPLSAYAANEPSSRFTFGFGFLSQGVITGQIYTLPQPLQVHRLGKVNVHLFCPDDPDSSGQVNKAPTWMAKVALYVPAIVEYKEQVRVERELRLEKERQLKEMALELSAAATERDALRRILQSFSTTGDLPERLVPKRFDLMDFITLSLPTVTLYVIAENIGVPSIIGLFIGLMIGALWVFRRRGE